MGPGLWAGGVESARCPRQNWGVVRAPRVGRVRGTAAHPHPLICMAGLTAEGIMPPEGTQTPAWVTCPGKRFPPRLSLAASLQPLRLKDLQLGRRVGTLPLVA
ncbi:hypothetical protein J1605_008773 [Eschrichtius robustus]|uniref:Uncharacterized protein n=1 Tax=Eschrichtius robustus TaxID=9764 RepID=A0AB34GYL0_ESCRO|nr:hypothetical protein J1605_008773 [Eschrichtius robustus]